MEAMGERGDIRPGTTGAGTNGIEAAALSTRQVAHQQARIGSTWPRPNGPVLRLTYRGSHSVRPFDTSRRRSSHGSHRHRRHRIRPHSRRAGHVHDSGVGAVLRRYGAEQERAGNGDAEHGGHRGGLGALGPPRLHARLRPRRGARDRFVGVGGPARRRPGAQRRLRGDRPRARFHDLPGHVRRDHTRSHHRRLRRADEVLELPGVHRPMVAPRVQPDRPLGVGRRRLDPGHGGPGLRRWHRGAHKLRRRRPGGGLRRRPAQGVRQGVHASAQRPHDCAGRGHPLVRLVRLQRRERPGGQRPGRQRVGRDRIFRRPPPACRGRLPSGCISAVPRRWASPRARSPAWWRSRPLRASSGPCRRS